MTARSDEVIIWCPRCQANTPSRDVEVVTMRNGRPATIATCVRCGSRKFETGPNR